MPRKKVEKTNNKATEAALATPAPAASAPTPAPTPVEAFAAEVLERTKSSTVIPIIPDRLGPWSYSRYKSLTKCPLQFFLKNILKVKIPEGAAKQDDPTSANVGKAAHQILEDCVRFPNLKLDEVTSKVRKEYVEGETPQLSPEAWEEKVETLFYNITKFVERIESFGRANPIKAFRPEVEVALSRELKPVPFFSPSAWIRGYIDLVIELENGDIIILDHKTGAVGSIKPYEAQLDWYKVMYHFGQSRVRGAQSAVHFIREGDLKMGAFTPAKDIENKLLNTLEMSIEGAVESVVSTGKFKRVRGGYCQWCDFDNMGCKSGDLKPVEEASKRFFENGQ